MLLGYNTNGLQNHRLEDALRLLADEGYAAVALTLDVVHLDPFRASAREVERTAGLLERLGLQPVIETGARFLLDPRRKHEPTLMTRDPDLRERRLELYDRAGRIGADLGARVVSFWTGVDRQPGEDSGERMTLGISLMCERVRRHGLVPALEPEPGMAVETLADYARVRGALGAVAPALCLDVGHIYVTGEGEPAELIPRFAHDLAQVHLEDVRTGVHEHLPPGEGDVDFATVRAALRSAGYQGPVCFELSRSSHRAPEVVRLCRRAWDEAGD